MAIQNKTTLKSYFETGDVPTEEQFADLIDSMTTSSDIWLDCASSITQADLNKAVTIGTDGKLSLYSRSPATAEIKGKWELTLNQITQPADQGSTTQFVYNTNSMWEQFDNDQWKDSNSAMQPATSDDELLLIRDYINNNYSNLLTASVAASVLTLLEVEALQAELIINNDPIGAMTITESQASIPAKPELSDKPFIGIIKDIDETNHKCTLFQNGIVECIAATDIDISSSLSNQPVFEVVQDYFYWLSFGIIPVDGGGVRLIDPQTELTSPASALNILGGIGFALSNALAGEKVIVKLLK